MKVSSIYSRYIAILLNAVVGGLLILFSVTAILPSDIRDNIRSMLPLAVLLLILVMLVYIFTATIFIQLEDVVIKRAFRQPETYPINSLSTITVFAGFGVITFNNGTWFFYLPDVSDRLKSSYTGYGKYMMEKIKKYSTNHS